MGKRQREGSSKSGEAEMAVFLTGLVGAFAGDGLRLSGAVVPQRESQLLQNVTALPGGTPFLVFSHARCGTEWMQSMMNAQAGICMDGEVLMNEKRGHVKGVVEEWGNQDYSRNTLKLGHGAAGGRGDWEPCKEARGNAKEMTAYGFKYFNGEGDTMDFTAEKLGSVETWVLNYLKENKFRIIFLKRLGLDRKVSRLKHTHHTSMCDTEECMRQSAARKVHVDAKELPEYFEKEELEWELLSKLTHSEFPKEHLYELTYDELKRDPDGQMKAVFHLLGLDSPAKVDSSLTLKMGASNIMDSIENADEVVEALKGTKWEKYLAQGDQEHDKPQP